MKIRVYDKTRERYGILLTINFKNEVVIYGLPDEDGDPMEPTILPLADCSLEVNINEQWTLLSQNMICVVSNKGIVKIASWWKKDADLIGGETISLSDCVTHINLDGFWTPVELEAI